MSSLSPSLRSSLARKWGGARSPVLRLSNMAIDEDAADNSVVGALSVKNLGSRTVSSYAITADPDAKFAIVSTDLTIDELLNYEDAMTHSVTIQATLSDASTVSSTFTIAVNNVDEGAPTPAAVFDTAANSALVAVLFGDF